MWCGKVVFATAEAHGCSADFGLEEAQAIDGISEHLAKKIHEPFSFNG